MYLDMRPGLLLLAICVLCAAQTRQPNIIVIGAGFSGLSAARVLQDAGATVTVLEGRNRIGGRVWSDRSLGFACDLGASWIHGPIPYVPTWSTSPTNGFAAAPTSFATLQTEASSWGWTGTIPPSSALYPPRGVSGVTTQTSPWNPITVLAYAAGVPLVKTYFSSTNTYNADGAISSGTDAQGDSLMSSFSSNYKQYRTALGTSANAMSVTQVVDYMLANPSTPGITGALATACNGAACTSTSQLMAVPKMAYQINSNLEFQVGGGMDSIGATMYDSDYNMGASGTNENWLFPNGYDQLATRVANTSKNGPLNIVYSKTVTALSYSTSGCTVTAGGTTYTGDACVSTLPAGVMKTNNINWSPSFPTDKANALQRLKMGDLGGPNKVFLYWPTKWWQNTELFNGFFKTSPTAANRGNFSYVVDFSTALSKPVLMAFWLGNAGAFMEQQSLWENWLTIKATLTAACVATAGTSSALCNPTATGGTNTIPDPFNSTSNFIYDANGTVVSGGVRSTWIADPFAKGAYSYGGPSATDADFDTMAASVADSAGLARVFFAGEHTSRWYRGSVHAAWISGQRAANEAITNFNSYVPGSGPATPAPTPAPTRSASCMWSAVPTLALALLAMITIAATI